MGDVFKLLSCSSLLRYSSSSSLLITTNTFASSSSSSFDYSCIRRRGPLPPGLHRKLLLSSVFVPPPISFTPCNNNLTSSSSSFKMHATVTETDAPKWWQRNTAPNMIDIHSTQEFLTALSEAGEKLVIVEFYATWCASCRALFPKFCRTAAEHKDIIFLKVDFDENKPMCKSLNVKVLPKFHFYRGADGRLESFPCSLAKFQKIKDAIQLHNTARCSIGPPLGVGDLDLESFSHPKEKEAESSGTST